MAEQFEGTQIEAIARALGHTEGGLSGTEIEFLLGAAHVQDVDRNNTKWKRLHNALAMDQNARQDRIHILAFIRKAMKPERWLSQHEKYEPLRTRLNQALLFSGLAVKEDGELIEVKKVSTIGDAQRRSAELKAALLKRDAHPDVLVFCRAELLAENFFHAVLEATKSVAAKLRSKSGLTGDGSALVDAALSGDSPKLIVNAFTSDSEKSEQRGFATLLKGIFGMFRNPTAHEPRIHWPMKVEDAADLLSTVSLIHRRLDRAELRQP